MARNDALARPYIGLNAADESRLDFLARFHHIQASRKQVLSGASEIHLMPYRVEPFILASSTPKKLVSFCPFR